MDGDEVGAEVERDAEQARQAGGEAPRGDARVGLDHGDGADAGVATGKQSGKGNQLRAQDDRSFEGPAAGEVDEGLQRPGGDHAERARAADEAGGAAGLAPAGDRKSTRLKSTH